jgi:hypothetical protein
LAPAAFSCWISGISGCRRPFSVVGTPREKPSVTYAGLFGDASGDVVQR